MRLSASFGSTSNNKKHRTDSLRRKDGYAVHAILPRPEGRGLSRNLVKARNWFSAHAIDHTFIDYRDHPVPATTLSDWAKQLGGWEKLVNRASMTWRNLPEIRKTPVDASAWLQLIAEYPALVRRPLIVDATGAISAGFSEKRYLERFG